MPIQDKASADDKAAPAPCRVGYALGDQQLEWGISAGFHERGMLVKCDKPAPLNKRLKLTLKFSELEQSLEIHAVVVWTNIHGSADDLTPRAMGVKFLNVDRNLEQLLTGLASHYEARGGGYGCYYS